MAKVSKEKLLKLKQFDRPPLDYQNKAIASFFEQAMQGGYSLDTTGFLQHPGFFQAPHRRESLGDVDIAMVGCPLDLGSIGLVGSRHAPKALREASRNYGPVHDVTGDLPFSHCNIIDYGDVAWSEASLETRVCRDIANTLSSIAADGAATLACGGEHTSTYGILKGLSEAHQDSFALVQIDAHCDTMAAWDGDVVNIGSVFRQAILEGFVEPERAIQIGIRGRSGFLWEFSKDVGMTVITADEVFEKGVDYVNDKVREIVGDAKTYFTLDVDGIDSAYMMGTTGPEPFGLTPRQVRSFIMNAYDLDVIGADIMELNPNRDPNGYAAHLAGALFWELLCMLAHCRKVHGQCRGATIWG